MHELSICQSLVSQLNDISSEYPNKVIVTVHLQIGPLSGVVPQLLRDAFPIASAGTAAANAVLEIHEGEIQVHCDRCGQDTVATSNRLVCSHCGDWQTMLVSGDELMLERVELESEQPQAMVH